MARLRVLWRHDCSGQMCNISGCFSCALRKGAAWNRSWSAVEPKLDCVGKGHLQTRMAIMQTNIDGNNAD